MAFLDAVIVLTIFALIYFFVYPALVKVVKYFSKDVPLEGDLGKVEEEVNSAIDSKQKADEATARAKQKADDLLHKAQDLHKKL